MSFILAASPLVALAQLQDGAESPARGAQPGQPQPQGAQPQELRELQVVATVNGDPITVGEVQAALQPQLEGRQVEPQVAEQLQKQAVDSLIDSRLIEQYALEKAPDIKQQEVKAVVDRVQEQLAAQEVELERYLVSRGHTPDSFKDRIKGSIAWQKLQQQQLTDENLARFYQENQQQFNAGSFEEARQDVANAYLGEVWKQIISQTKPAAEIRGVPAARPAPQRPPQPAPAP
jgi:hypothetical protein